MKTATREAQSIPEAVALVEMMEGGDPELRAALVNLVKQGKVAVGVRDGVVVFQAIPAAQ